MEECEALCARIGIMVNGRFRCLGSTQHLRSKYGQGYSVTISLKKTFEANQEYLNSVQQGVASLLPSALLKDYHQCLMHYHIADPNEKWSNIFRQMSALSDRFDFEDYVVSDTTLEQVRNLLRILFLNSYFNFIFCYRFLYFLLGTKLLARC